MRRRRGCSLWPWNPGILADTQPACRRGWPRASSGWRLASQNNFLSVSQAGCSRLLSAARIEYLQRVSQNMSQTFSDVWEPREVLRELYADRAFQPRVWLDPADAAYPGILLIERSIARLAPELTGELLDVGCGRQPYAKYFTHVARKRTCDFNAARGEVDFTCPADRIPLLDASLDSILCTEVLEHVPDPRAVWREFARVL